MRVLDDLARIRASLGANLLGLLGRLLAKLGKVGAAGRENAFVLLARAARQRGSLLACARRHVGGLSACGLPGQPACPAGTSCITGCCVPNPM